MSFFSYFVITTSISLLNACGVNLFVRNKFSLVRNIYAYKKILLLYSCDVLWFITSKDVCVYDIRQVIHTERVIIGGLIHAGLIMILLNYGL